MTNTKMLQILIDGQAAIRDDLKKMQEEVRKNTSRLDKIGMWLAGVEDDTPSTEAFDKLEERVTKLEQRNFQTP